LHHLSLYRDKLNLPVLAAPFFRGSWVLWFISGTKLRWHHKYESQILATFCLLRYTSLYVRYIGQVFLFELCSNESFSTWRPRISLMSLWSCFFIPSYCAQMEIYQIKAFSIILLFIFLKFSFSIKILK